MDPVTPESDRGVIVVTQAILRPGNVWHVLVQLPDWTSVWVAVPSSAASLAQVRVAASAVATLLQAGRVTA